MIIWLFLLTSSAFLLTLSTFQSQTYYTRISPNPQPRFLSFPDDENTEGFLIKTEGCKIPEMNVTDPSISSFIFKEKPVICNKGVPALVDSNLTSIYLLNTSFPHYGINDTELLDCCYSPFKRVDPAEGQTDDEVHISACNRFNDSANISDSYIIVRCNYNEKEIYKDFFSFVVERGYDHAREETRPNVLILGIDSLSRLNFLRQMPKTYEALKNIKAVDFLGYNKVADNTFPNLVPVLTGLSESELQASCWPTTDSHFDKCSFVWERFKKERYVTAFGEDASWMGVFNYQKRGFHTQPTDYYWRTFDREAEKQIGNEHHMNVNECLGAREVYKIFLNFVEKFAKTSHRNQNPFFAFFWGSSLSHDFLNKPQLGDEDYERFIAEMEYHGVLKDTIFILMSDHGIRWGDIRKTNQGRIEERLPFLQVYLPDSFRSSHPVAFSNLMRNRRRLTTPYDLHETLRDLANQTSMTDEFLRAATTNNSSKRGYSLFEEIPTKRTCQDAGVDLHWCTCQSSVALQNNEQVVLDVVNFTIAHLNDKLFHYKQCVPLTLGDVLDARSLFQTANVTKEVTDYEVSFVTKPGDGVFEVTVRKKYVDGYHKFEITGTVSRINLYGEQSSCVDDFHIKLYCFCRYLL